MRNDDNVRDRSHTISEQYMLNIWQLIIGVIATAVTLIVLYSDNNKNNRNKIVTTNHSMFAKLEAC